MKKQNIEKLLAKALKTELAAFPQPSRQLRGRLMIAAPLRMKKNVLAAAFGFVSVTIVLLFLCVEWQQKPEIIHDYFEPTKTIDLNDLSFEPNKTIELEN